VHTDTGVSIKFKSGKGTKAIAKGDEKKHKGKGKKSDAIYIYKVISLHYVLIYHHYISRFRTNFFRMAAVPDPRPLKDAL